MLLLGGSLASPRRLGLLAVIVFVLAILFLQSSPYAAHLPAISKPAFAPSDFASSKAEGYVQTKEQKRPQTVTPAEALRPTENSNAGNGPVTTSLHHSRTRQVPSPTSRGTTQSSQTRTTIQHAFKSRSHEPHEAVQTKIQSLISQWMPPDQPAHWPPYQEYWYQDYDPNAWEGLEWENAFYINNGIAKLKEQSPAATPAPYLPYPAYDSDEWRRQWEGEFVFCKGPRGKRLNESMEDVVKAYPFLPKDFPSVAIGDANVIGIDISHCLDRYGRFGAYGYAQDEATSVTDWEKPKERPDWNWVDWGELQDYCLLDNRDRYADDAQRPADVHQTKDVPADHLELPREDPSQAPGRTKSSRTALLIRSWEGYMYTSNDYEAIRALITELSLMTGGEYQVFLLVNVKDPFADIYNDDQVYKDMLELHVPRELQSISILWNEAMLEQWYPKIGDWQIYWHQFMPLQWFSKKYPEFDYVWNWETDARYTGNHYHFMEKLREFSKKQPRKYLWERNARFYIPSAHGSYSSWLDDTHANIQKAIEDGSMEPVWGPQPYNETIQKPIGPKAPYAMETDDFEWGVGEEADLITLQPIWDPAHTEWTMKDKIWNYLPGIRPHFTDQSPVDEGFTHPDFVEIPRRAYINTVSRFSRRQLHAMHLENLAGRTMQAEMWPATVALQHGLKAVYAPHPIWTDRKWPGWYMDAIFNADGQEPGRWGARADSVYNHDREHNFGGWSWYYGSEFPRILYRRWLGWTANIGSPEQYPNNPLLNIGGEVFENEGIRVELPGPTPDGSQAAPAGGSFGGREIVVGGHGRMCLPPMLLHPIKKVYRGAEEDAMRGTV